MLPKENPVLIRANGVYPATINIPSTPPNTPEEKSEKKSEKKVEFVSIVKPK
jgi:hypothetical protein